MEQAIAKIKALRELVLDGPRMEFKDEIAAFKPLVAQFVPTVEEIIAMCKESHEEYGLLPDQEGLQEIEGVSIIYDCFIMDAYGKKVHNENMWDSSYSETAAMCQLFMEQNKCSYYSACKEDFFVFMAVSLAQKEGNKYVIMENLS